MNCPNCNGYMPVVDSGNTGDAVYRKRKCSACGAVIYTEELEAPDRRVQRRLGHLRYMAKHRQKGDAAY